MTEWQQCVIVGCDCRRKNDTPPRGGWCGDEWVCRGHWSMTKKRTRLMFIRARRKLMDVSGGSYIDVVEDRKISRIYHYLWDRLKCQITQEAIGL